MNGTQASPAALRRAGYYEILELPPGASGAAVERAYWRLARTYHDRLPTDPLAAVMLDKLNQAFEALAKPPAFEAEEAPVKKSRRLRLPLPTRAARSALKHGAASRFSAMALVLGISALTLSPTFQGATRASATKPLAGVSVSAAPVIFLGDSVTHGAGASSPDVDFAQLLAARLDGAGFASGPADYDSVISAMGGQIVDMRFAQDIGARPRSLIVVEVGAHSAVEDPELTPAEYGIGYSKMLDCLEGTGAIVVVSTIPWLSWSHSDPVYQRAAERSYMIKAVADAHGIAVADLWTNMKDRPELLSDDRFHPNDAGHLLIADLYWQQIEPQLAQPRRTFENRCAYDTLLASRRLSDPDGPGHKTPDVSPAGSVYVGSVAR